MAPLVGPPVRDFHAMAYDSRSDRVILFGGWGGYGNPRPLGDTWAYDFSTNTWTQMFPAVGPPARMYFAMTYDNQSDRVILFGGGGPSFHFYHPPASHLKTNTGTDNTPAAL